MHKIVYTADVEGDWCVTCGSRTYDTAEEALAAISADPTAGPDCYGNECYPEVVHIEGDET